MLRPLEDKIIVKPDIQEEVTSSGLFLAGLVDEKQGTGIVVAKGPGLMLNNGDFVVPDLEIGDKVAFGKYGGTEVEHDGENLLILAYRDILAVLG